MSKFIFKPPIEERETDELISMKWNGIDYWSEEASVLAAQELIRRKVCFLHLKTIPLFQFKSIPL